MELGVWNGGVPPSALVAGIKGRVEGGEWEEMEAKEELRGRVGDGVTGGVHEKGTRGRGEGREGEEGEGEEGGKGARGERRERREGREGEGERMRRRVWLENTNNTHHYFSGDAFGSTLGGRAGSWNTCLKKEGRSTKCSMVQEGNGYLEVHGTLLPSNGVLHIE